MIDSIISEPLGGAHREPDVAINKVAEVIEKSLNELAPIPLDTLIQQRRAKFLEMGQKGLG